MEATQEKGFWDDAEIIDVYSRADALADGVLIDVSHEEAIRLYFKVPAVITATVQAELEQHGETVADIVKLFFDYANLENTANTDRVNIQWHDDPLIFHIGPGDTAAPVLTIMRPIDD